MRVTKKDKNVFSLCIEVTEEDMEVQEEIVYLLLFKTLSLLLISWFQKTMFEINYSTNHERKLWINFSSFPVILSQTEKEVKGAL